MRTLWIFITICTISLSLTGCSGAGKPEDTVKEYLKRASTYDIAGLKKLCTGEAWKSLDDMAADIDVDKVMVENTQKVEKEGQRHWADVESRYDITVQDNTSSSATVLVISGEQKVTFDLIMMEGSWKIDRISNPNFGLTPIK